MAIPFSSAKPPDTTNLNVDKITFPDSSELTTMSAFVTDNYMIGGEDQKSDTDNYTLEVGQVSPIIDETQGTPFGDDFGGSLHDNLLATVTNNGTSTRKILICANVVCEGRRNPEFYTASFWRGNASNGYGKILRSEGTALSLVAKCLAVFDHKYHSIDNTSTLMSSFISYIDDIQAGETVSYCPVVMTTYSGSFHLSTVKFSGNSSNAELGVSCIWTRFLN